MCPCVRLLIYSMHPVKLRKQDNQICSGLLWNTRGSCSQRGEERACVTQDGGHGSVGVSCRQRDGRDAEPAAKRDAGGRPRKCVRAHPTGLYMEVAAAI